ncbi:preprotein translocase subunit YajC [Sciscionella sediminilitoris]|uniref:preprotein translocase subunit YajC n=1 Tax=Sciscionella sediminilitoris TaxID=1445613 RepID=UPI0004DF9BF5|nr:preprotein translocase subunit YajC [Sciscionella sp. SE31]
MSQTLILPLLILVLAIPMFFSFRKQKRMQQQQRDLQSSIGPGDRVMTTSGLYGTVSRTDDTTIDIEIAPGMVTTWLRQAVREKVQPETEADTATTAETPAESSENTEPAEVEATSGASVAEPLEHKTR